MNDAARPVARRRGFSILEALVALVLTGLLIGAVAPTVVTQIGKGAAKRMVGDLRTLEVGVKLFRSDVGQWPERLGQLPAPPPPGSRDVYRETIPAEALRGWRGPYIESGLVVGDSVRTAGGAVIAALDTVEWDGNVYVAFTVRGVRLSDAKRVSAVLDGDTIVAPRRSEDLGRVRWTPKHHGTLVYLAATAR